MFEKFFLKNTIKSIHEGALVKFQAIFFSRSARREQQNLICVTWLLLGLMVVPMAHLPASKFIIEATIAL